MSERPPMDGSGGISNVQELVTRIRQGLVPRAVRLFAAQGLLPVAREELIRVVVVLAIEGDEEIAAAAKATLTTFTSEQLRAVLGLSEVESVEIDLLARAVQDHGLWTAIVRDPRASDETLRWLARGGDASVQDAIITNQRRLMGCLELLDDLRANPSADPSVLRRVKEFEEEFLEKACHWAESDAEEPFAEPGPSIERELGELRALGMQIDLVERELTVEPPLPGEIPDEAAVSELAFLRIARMNVFERIMCALKGSREERMILVRDRNLLVVRAVMSSPRMTDHEVEAIASMRGANDEALRMIGKKGAWVRRYTIIRNLVFNPKTPTGVAMPLISRLADRDLGILGRDRNVPEAVRRFARQVRDTRR